MSLPENSHEQQNSQSTFDFVALPDELQALVISLLPLSDMKGMRSVSRVVKSNAEDELIWKQKIATYFPRQYQLLLMQESPSTSYYHEFKHLWRQQYQRFHPTMRTLFSVVREGTREEFLAAFNQTLGLKDFPYCYMKVSLGEGGVNLIDLVLERRDPQLNLALFLCICDQFQHGNKPDYGQLIRFAIRLNQPWETVVSCLQRAKRKHDHKLTDFVDSGVPFSLAMRYKNQAVLEKLMAFGFCQPFHLAAGLGQVDQLKALIKERAINRMTPDGLWTAINLAANNGQLQCLQVLIESGVYIENPTCSTPLMRAAINGHVQCVRALIKAGAKVNVVDVDGSTPLSLAACAGEYQCVQALLEHGASLEYVDGKGNTALMLAVKNGSVSCMQLLISSNATLEHVNHDGDTALTLAIKSGDVSCVIALMRAGASTLKMPPYGKEIKQGIASILKKIIKQEDAENNLNTLKVLLKNRKYRFTASDYRKLATQLSLPKTNTPEQAEQLVTLKMLKYYINRHQDRRMYQNVFFSIHKKLPPPFLQNTFSRTEKLNAVEAWLQHPNRYDLVAEAHKAALSQGSLGKIVSGCAKPRN